MKQTEECLEALRARLQEIGVGGICLAYSGGVDSALLLKLCRDLQLENGMPFQAVTFQTSLHPQADLEQAEKLARELGVQHHIIHVDEFADPQIMKNPTDRCYLCKRLLFSKLLEYAEKSGLRVVADGTNADDLREYRPGLQALQELKIASPLKELGIGKQQVRDMLSEMKMAVASKPSSPCMATRLPYYDPITPEALNRIEQGEAYLKKRGFSTCRLRVHGDIARIEVPMDQFDSVFLWKTEICRVMKEYGFSYITLDLEGFRSGSMDLHIRQEGKKEVLADGC